MDDTPEKSARGQERRDEEGIDVKNLSSDSEDLKMAIAHWEAAR